MRLNFLGGILAVLGIAALMVAYSSLFTVYQTQQAFALISGTDEMSIKYKRDKVGDHSGRYDNRRHKPLGHNSSYYE